MKAHTKLIEDEMKDFDYAIMPDDRYDRLKFLQDAEVLFATKIENVPLILVLEIPD